MAEEDMYFRFERNKSFLDDFPPENIRTTVGDLIAAIFDAADETHISEAEHGDWVKAVLVSMLKEPCA